LNLDVGDEAGMVVVGKERISIRRRKYNKLKRKYSRGRGYGDVICLRH
jgi:hypothetical protein